MSIFPSIFSRIAGFSLAMGSLLLVSCASTVEVDQRSFIQETFQKAMISYEDGAFKQAQTAFESIIEKNPGTRYASLAYLKLGELHFTTEDWADAETNYRLYLTLNPSSHLTPHVLNRLIELNYKRNFQGLFVETRDFERDMGPNRKIIQEYQRFFFLFPNNIYLKDSKEYLFRAKDDLARYEYLVGNFYFDQQAYHAAIARYLYLLKHFPDFSEIESVGQQLLAAYEANQQPHLATEMQKAMGVRFGQNGNL